ncbi:27 kDa glycoprotein-like [Cydia pomonella]|uniref:27 kDa glycoprotein-like n=1 Tax=Cydia pomonella TaxID=82600 RepID=UPI002ADD8E1F|nr:27 kDa glycoprotein-like [Cydia pomonella]
MLWKFVVVASLALGVYGRSTVNVPDNSPFDEYSQLVIREYCNATHAEDKTSEVKSAMIAFAKCLNDAIDFEIFAKEMEKAENSGVYDEVIQKYCAKAPQLKECTSDLVRGMSPCLPAGLDRSAVKSTNTLIDFVCDNNGARITSFIREDGPRCIKDKMFYIAYCQDVITSNLTKFTNASRGGLASSLYTISEMDRCVLVDQSLECLVNVIKSCPNPAIGKLGQEFHDVYLESLSCSEVTQHANTGVLAEGIADTAIGSSDEGNKDIDQLKKIKLELEVRTAELDIWYRENELNVQHTALTSDIKPQGH